MNSSDEQRHFSRIPFDAAVVVDTEDRQLRGELLDISLKGALVKVDTPHSLTAGDAATLHIRLSDEQGIDMQTTVVHVAGQQAGFRCEHIDVDSITHLARLVELNTGDSELLHRELSALGEGPDRP